MSTPIVLLRPHESVVASWAPPTALVGRRCSMIAAYLVALVVLWARPYEWCGTPDAERV